MSEGIYTPSPEGEEDKRPTIAKLIEIEWTLIKEMLKAALNAQYDKHRIQYFNALSSHARTLAWLLQQAPASREDKEDLARIIQEIRKGARKGIRGLKRVRIPAGATQNL